MNEFTSTVATGFLTNQVTDMGLFLYAYIGQIMTIVVALLALGMAMRYVSRHISGPSFGTGQRDADGYYEDDDYYTKGPGKNRKFIAG